LFKLKPKTVDFPLILGGGVVRFAWQQSSGPNVRFGSKADIEVLQPDVRSTPQKRTLQRANRDAQSYGSYIGETISPEYRRVMAVPLMMG
jgi:hypothetical protein